ncbi:hypothetical protein XSR1_260039 [Xenorhabdus szentirmaii DSM 16338]|uniref:Uncharacterized protein n=1 Tax=Xenorhabdus szentirmaii DSM 16338 TaxID=1427518 RepID=W1J0G4_9GAMM|nr:hypothetical protein XSR1_260039 [Xenorhabdus szentirmaii DSM 16338]
MSAIPIGAPGCPDFAFCTASMLKKRIALARVLRVVILYSKSDKSVSELRTNFRSAAYKPQSLMPDKMPAKKNYLNFHSASIL